jgi:hypothetical protein
LRRSKGYVVAEVAEAAAIAALLVERGLTADAGDVDLELRSLEGRVLAADSGPAPQATSGWCAPPGAPPRVPVVWEVRAYRGSGGVQVEVMEGPP